MKVQVVVTAQVSEQGERHQPILFSRHEGDSSPNGRGQVDFDVDHERRENHLKEMCLDFQARSDDMSDLHWQT